MTDPGEKSGLVADLQLTLGDFRLAAELDAESNRTVALVGPNGAGKTTVLRTLAGLLPLDSGRIELDGTVLDEPSRSLWVPPERRSVGFVFQDYLLFPHLTTLDNVAFGLRCRGSSRRRARRRAGELLERLGLGEHAETSPGSLSGGQAQRVALARALAVEPRLLLLDEPLSALDATTRMEIRRDLRQQLASFEGTRLLVTHDPVEAMVLADRIVVLEGGKVVQAGSTSEISRRPRSPYVAGLVGLNFYQGVVRGHRLEIDGGGALYLAETPVPEGARAFATVRPQSVALFQERPEGTPRNVWQVRVASYDQEGDRVRVEVQGIVPMVAEITPPALAELGLGPGTVVWVAIKATDVRAYPV